MAIGWPDIGDLSTLEATKEGREKLVALLQEKYPTAPQATGRSRVQISNFVTSISEGDLVLAADGNTIIGIGRVMGEYVYDPSSDFPHHRPVEWLSFDEWKTPTPEGLQTTVYEVRKYPNILEAERKIQNKGPIGGGTKVVRQGSAPRLAGIPGRIQAVLERKSQVILYGPPGTGKTFWAERTACDLASYWAFGKSFEELEPNQKTTVMPSGQNEGLVRLCCFHPAYGYEDFLEGYRPETVNGQISFSLRAGVFMVERLNDFMRNMWCIDWVGQFRDLCEGSGEFPEKIREFYYEDSDVDSSAPVSADMAEEFKECLQHYGF